MGLQGPRGAPEVVKFWDHHGGVSESMGWQAVTAISLAVLAVTGVVLAVAAVVSLREIGRLVDRLSRLAEMLERDGAPLLAATRALTEDARQIVSGVGAEVSELVAGSRRLRGGLEDAAEALAARTRDLEAVLDIVQEEVEETALEVAAALRSTRRGISLLGALKRALVRGRR